MQTQTMRAVVHDRYGPPEVLRVEEVEKPEPAEGELLVRVRATTVTQTDCHMRRARPYLWRPMLGWTKPRRRVLGLELAGEVEAVGAGVRDFSVGDRVFGMRSGAHAEYVCVREAGFVARMPAGATFEEAAAICDGANQGLGSLEEAGVGEGTRLLVYGASGSCGTAAVQLGKHHFGAHVTGVTETRNLELVRSLGADDVIDYTREDFTQTGQTWDVVLDAVGKHSFARSRRALRSPGTYVATDRLYNIPLRVLTAPFSKKVGFALGFRPRPQNVHLFKELVEAGHYRPVIDLVYPLEDVVEATRRVESWQKVGNVVLTL